MTASQMEALYEAEQRALSEVPQGAGKTRSGGAHDHSLRVRCIIHYDFLKAAASVHLQHLPWVWVIGYYFVALIESDISLSRTRESPSEKEDHDDTFG